MSVTTVKTRIDNLLDVTCVGETTPVETIYKVTIPIRTTKGNTQEQFEMDVTFPVSSEDVFLTLKRSSKLGNQQTTETIFQGNIGDNEVLGNYKGMLTELQRDIELQGNKAWDVKILQYVRDPLRFLHEISRHHEHDKIAASGGHANRIEAERLLSGKISSESLYQRK